MSRIKIADIAYVRLQSPSLHEAEEFLTDFGLVRVHAGNDVLYMRGTDGTHYVHITHRGPPKVLGFGFYADSEEDLHELRKSSDASPIEHVDEPGGGKRVRLMDPLGYQIEVVTGMRPASELSVRPQRKTQQGHVGRGPRFSRAPSQVKRLAHVVLAAQSSATPRAWYREMFGLRCSDEIYVGTRENVIASFDRCNRGSVPVDHHTVLITNGPRSGVNHVCFEVQSIDDLMVGHDFLRSRLKYQHVGGVGRHSTSAQVFDYWKDPWGRIHEHCVDTDLLDAASPSNAVALEQVRGGQWGPELSKEFVEYATP
jgi:catechol 2,3-dioxygenase-like lactoylglutathione lyase family enzyme